MDLNFTFIQKEWIDVPDSSNPPASAEVVSPANMNRIEAGIQESLDKIVELKEYTDTSVLSYYGSVSVNADDDESKEFNIPSSVDLSKYVAIIMVKDVDSYYRNITLPIDKSICTGRGGSFSGKSFGVTLHSDNILEFWTTGSDFTFETDFYLTLIPASTAVTLTANE